MWLWGRHKVDDWREGWTLSAAATLNEVAAQLGRHVDDEVAKASYRDVLLAPGTIIATRIAPRVEEVALPIVTMLMGRANEGLREIVDHQAVWHERPDMAPVAPGPWEGAGDVIGAAVPLGGGAAIAMALPFAAISTKTALFGLVATTAVSWPVVVVGGAVAGTALLTGAVSGARLRDRFAGRLRLNARKHIATRLLTGSAKNPSLLQQVTACLTETAKQAKKL